MFETQGQYIVTRDVREQVTWHYGRERNQRGGDTMPDGAVVETQRPKAGLKPLFFTFVVSTYATRPCTHVHGRVAYLLTTKVKNEGH
jgi:hypothetical protein